ncbi:TPA: YggT family protein [Candidatus Poribacteria bacterium]|jgi:uncharacterized protein YggT (Ycf19 family)|nr:YggT family protein [Candidatus Poribacteria bacterium]HIA70169.1 YggT family protein [Candidatus Poribacteria bacterium]HIB89504.1 YggT family protein [Candidatus Poribacteria bacterium]HIC01740.1 YggT family protein [Candidatus Poribacteria bacterium]HIC19303.1 YggT family protein [Candidatus Poribacteria bacterium]
MDITLILSGLIRIYIIIVVVNVLLSWFVHTSHNMTVRRVYRTTSPLVDPVLDPIRRVISPMTKNIGFDISPIILIFLLQFISRMLG